MSDTQQIKWILVVRRGGRPVDKDITHEHEGPWGYDDDEAIEAFVKATGLHVESYWPSYLFGAGVAVHVTLAEDA